MYKNWGIMFGLFSKQKFKYSCPMCKREYSIRLNPSKPAGVIFKVCEFCKLKFTLNLIQGIIKTIDRKWESVQQEHDKKISTVEEQIYALKTDVKERKGQLNQHGINTQDIEEEINQLEKKIDQLDLIKRNLAGALYIKEVEYSERQIRWEQKWQYKQKRG
jgi:septal ring factor EnvC (AmiA/AmiB activator)